MFNPLWFQVNKKPSQYQGIKGDIQPPLFIDQKNKGYPAVHPFNKHAPAPIGKRPSPLFFQQQKLAHQQHQKQRQYFYIVVLLFISLVFSGTTLIWQWGKNSYHFVSAHANEGQQHLLLAQQALEKQDFNLAVTEFVQASASFREAKKTLAPAVQLPFENPAKAAYFLLDTGELLAQAGEQTCIGMAPVIDLVFSTEGEKGLDLTAGRFLKEIMIAFSTAESSLKQAVINVNLAEANLEKISSQSFDADIALSINQLKEKLPMIQEFLTLGYELSQFLPQMLGSAAEQKYMILFQNNWELRPTGGFLGSFSMLVLQDAKIKELYTKNVYDIEGQIKDYIQPPKPLEVAWPGISWGIRDANWDPHFPSSAELVEWFYQGAVSESIDGIIALDPTFMEYILKILGPLTISYNNQSLVVTADNLVSIIEEQERNTSQGTDPRKFLINLTSLVFDRLLAIEKENWPNLIGAIKTGLAEKHLLFNFHNPRAQQFIETRNWAGAIQPIDEHTDYLMINDANINGSKSCQLVKQEINLAVTVDARGKLQHKLTIVYQHTGTTIWPSSKVNYYTRTFVPLGSKLISATGNKLALTEISQAHDKTVFADYLSINPGDTVSLVYTYELPFSLANESLAAYKIYVQKQPGTTDPNLRFSMQLPPEFKPLSSPRKIEVTSNNEVWFLEKLNTDQEFEVLLKKE